MAVVAWIAVASPATSAALVPSVRAESVSGLTAKEKLSGKGADEQRVDDCKVPAAQRTRPDRPTDCAAAPELAAKLTADAVISAIKDATPSSPPRLAGQDLSGLDLTDLDFRRADLRGANLFGAKLVGANLSGADLSGANLDAAWLMRTNFAGANLASASLFGPVVYPTLDVTPANAPNFENANLAGARIVARLNRVNMRGSNLAGARMGVDMRNQPMGQMRVDLSGADLSGANLVGADLNRAVIAFARLTKADLRKANLFRADLSGSDLTAADLTGADVTEADLYGATIKDVRGFDELVGFDKARNREKIIQ
ncbi:MAG TPA: pentapeptide repeat-containing protein [Alphaproteobacteria bacterium]|nr:pentapeptide repeat-containing protein [Alphaproteobacteria bacterium]